MATEEKGSGVNVAHRPKKEMVTPEGVSPALKSDFNLRVGRALRVRMKNHPFLPFKHKSQFGIGENKVRNIQFISIYLLHTANNRPSLAANTEFSTKHFPRLNADGRGTVS